MAERVRWTNTSDGWAWNGWIAFRDYARPGRSWVLVAPTGRRRVFGRLRDAKAFAEAARFDEWSPRQ